MKTLVALLILLLIPVLSWAATCTISGIVYNPDGSPLANGQVQFNSVVTQVLGGGASVPVQFITTTTDPHGNLKPFAVVQGLQGQFVFCNPMAGGCSAPTPGLIPISATADISAILAGIQLASGGNVSANSLNVTGNTTLGGTLVVTGLSTFNGGLSLTGAANACFADLGCWGSTGIVGLTHLGIGTLSAVAGVRAQLGNLAIASALAASDALGTNINTNMSSGVHQNTGGQWIADISYPMFFTQGSNVTNGPEQSFMAWGPQTIGQPLDLTHRVQYMALRGNTPGSASGPGLWVESGGIYTINGGITANGGTLGSGLAANYNYNGPTYVVSNNTDSTDASVAAVHRAWNGSYVTDLAITGVNANLGGWFTANRGYVASNAPNGLLLEATGSGANAKLYLAAPNANQISVIGNNHFGFERDGVSNPPTAGSDCGGGAAVTAYSTDNAGYVQVTASTTHCTVTFGGGAIAATTPVCMCNGYSAGGTCTAVGGASGVALNFNPAMAPSTYVPWLCFFFGAPS